MEESQSDDTLLPKSAKSGSEEWFEGRQQARWEVVRRHAPYREFCDENISSFSSAGTWDGLFTPELDEIMKRYGLESVLHYSEDTPPPFLRELSIGYIYNSTQHVDNYHIYPESSPVLEWATGDEIHHSETLSPLWDSDSLRKMDATIDNTGPVHGRSGSGQRSQENCPSSDRRYVVLWADISPDITDAQLIQEFKEFVKDAREMAGIEAKKGRHRTLDVETLRVWDLHAAGKKPKEIIREMWPAEYEKYLQSDYDKDKIFKELTQLYKFQGCEDYDDRAHDEAYGNPDEKGIRMRSLYKRVSDHLEDMESFFDLYTKG